MLQSPACYAPHASPVWYANTAPSTADCHCYHMLLLNSACLQDALEWALYVQELLMWQHWPARLLALPAFREVAADSTSGGLPLFRGPR